MTTVTKKYQVTIPIDVRETLNIREGDKVVFIKRKEGYVIEKISELIEEASELARDIGKTVEESKKGLERVVA